MRQPATFLLNPVVAVCLAICLGYAQGLYPWQFLEGALWIMVVVLIAALRSTLESSLLRVSLTKIDIAVLCLLIYWALHSVITQVSIWYLVPLLGSSAIYGYLKISTAAKSSVLSILAYSSLATALYFLLQCAGFFTNPVYFSFASTSFFGHPAPMGGFLAICFPVTLHFCSQYHSTRSLQKAVIHGIPAVILTAILLSESRAALVGIVGGVVVYKWPYLRRRLHRILAPVEISILIPVAVSLLFLVYAIRPASVRGRLFVWERSLSATTHTLWFGTGAGHFSPTYMHHQSLYFQTTSATLYEKENAETVSFAYNEPIRILVEGGIIGLAISLTALLLTLMSILRCTASENLAVAGSLVSFAAFSIFSYPLSIFPIGLVLALLISFASSRQKPVISFIIDGSVRAKSLIVILIVSSIGLSVVGIHSLSRWHEAHDSIAYQTSVALAEYDDIKTTFQSYGPFLYDHGTELVRRNEGKKAVQVLSEAVKHSTGNEIYLFLGDAYRDVTLFSEAEAAYYEAHYREPFSIPPLYNLLLLYQNSNQHAKALETAKKIVCIPKKSTSLREADMQSYARAVVQRSS